MLLQQCILARSKQIAPNLLKKVVDTWVALQGKCYVIITDLAISLVLNTFWVISPRNSTLFTELFLTRRHTWAGHETILLAWQVKKWLPCHLLKVPFLIHISDPKNQSMTGVSSLIFLFFSVLALLPGLPCLYPSFCIHIIHVWIQIKWRRSWKRGYSVSLINFSRLAQYKHSVKGSHLYVPCWSTFNTSGLTFDSLKSSDQELQKGVIRHTFCWSKILILVTNTSIGGHRRWDQEGDQGHVPPLVKICPLVTPFKLSKV